MDRWVIFGFGHYLSDIADIIHARQGRIGAIVNNIRPTEKQWDDLKRRISLLGYDVPVLELSGFKPDEDEKYFYGFFNGRDKVLPELKRTYSIAFSPLIHPTAYLVESLPPGCTWSASGIGRFQTRIMAAAILMGGHVRIGIEDSLFYDYEKKELATNKGLVKRAVRMARELGRDIASPAETREILGAPR